ncbi:pirin family protein [Tissierella praeacuta]|uniref:pirin family protein n=1 Tax=Tissierella praeacuta TaxID=43131 RepID=UPI0028B03994|nr:pirin family protein [Tissierella praeacuta]
MLKNSILKIEKLDFMWQTEDPFLFCAHHKDNYPKGNDKLEPSSSELSGRNIGNDFILRNGWRMYHGKTIPGFPVHPHRGFETVTIVLEGFVDHSDSHGAAGRYGSGDVQWMTAGAGIQHAEMFPLINKDKDNPLHLFQVWLNLPKKDKFSDPHYKMLWVEDIPVIEEIDENEKKTIIKLISGKYNGTQALEPTPASWAKDEKNNVNIWIIKMEPKAKFELPASSSTITRNLYYYDGENISIDISTINSSNRIKLSGENAILITNGNKESNLLLLEGEPINEPVVAYGPFVMNTMEEIHQASRDYKETGFGGWPWNREDPVHSYETDRFAKYSDGTIEKRL